MASELAIGIPQVHQRIRVARVFARASLIALDRRSRRSRIPRQPSDVLARLRQRGLQKQGAAVTGEGGVEITLQLLDASKIVVCLSVVGVEADSASVGVRCSAKLARVLKGDTELVVKAGNLR